MREMYITSYQTPRKTRPKWIVLHYTGCEGTAEQICRSMARKKSDSKRCASTNYIIGESGEIIHAVDEARYYAWHCATAGIVTYCAANNANSIGIDLCTHRDAHGEWIISGYALRSAAQLIAELCRRYDIKLSNVVRHYDVTRKRCPRPLIDSASWANFLKIINEYL